MIDPVYCTIHKIADLKFWIFFFNFQEKRKISNILRFFPSVFIFLLGKTYGCRFYLFIFSHLNNKNTFYQYFSPFRKKKCIHKRRRILLSRAYASNDMDIRACKRWVYYFSGIKRFLRPGSLHARCHCDPAHGCPVLEHYHEYTCGLRDAYNTIG